jgi:predicted transcriptional regulator YdeE
MAKFSSLVIPASSYQKFTVVGKLPDVVISAWQQIWKMTPLDFEGKRSYKADFEIYDQRANNPNQATVDIFVGIERD